MSNKHWVAFAAIIATTAPLPATANNLGPVNVSTGVMMQVKNEYHAESEDKALDETNRLAARARLTPEIDFGGGLTVEGRISLKPMPQAKRLNRGDDVAFGHEGVFVENLYVEYDRDAFEVKAGKINPDYGKAWDYGRGIWGEDFAEDYEINEMIGVGTEYEFKLGALGEHEISAATFFKDTSALSDSALTSRGVTTRASGGAANTEDFSSFVAELEGAVPPVKGLEYRLGGRYLAEQAANQGPKTAAETGALVGATYTATLTDTVGIDVLLEHTHINNFDGTKDDNRTYSDISVVTTLYKNWNVATSMTLRDISGAGASSVSDDMLVNLTAGYDFGNGLSLDGGYRGTNEARLETHMFGLLLRYEGTFGR